MFELYSTLDYRQAIKSALGRIQSRGERLSGADLAAAMGIQPPYLSKVLSGRADLNEDQLHLLCERLKISEEEHQFLQLLLSIAKCGIKKRREALEIKALKLQQEKISPSRHREKNIVEGESIALSKYYLDPLAQVIHMFLLIPKWRKNIPSIAEKFQISAERLAGILVVLEDLRIIEFKNKQCTVLKEQMHLSKSHPLCNSQQKLLKMKALESSDSGDPKNFSFLAAFTADEKVRTEVQRLFMEFLKKADALIKDAPSEEVFHIQFDLLRW